MPVHEDPGEGELRGDLAGPSIRHVFKTSRGGGVLPLHHMILDLDTWSPCDPELLTSFEVAPTHPKDRPIIPPWLIRMTPGG